MVNYLIETLGKDDFVDLLSNKEKIANAKKDLLNKSIDYYNSLYD